MELTLSREHSRTAADRGSLLDPALFPVKALVEVSGLIRPFYLKDASRLGRKEDERGLTRSPSLNILRILILHSNPGRRTRCRRGRRRSFAFQGVHSGRSISDSAEQ